MAWEKDAGHGHSVYGLSLTHDRAEMTFGCGFHSGQRQDVLVLGTAAMLVKLCHAIQASSHANECHWWQLPGFACHRTDEAPKTYE